MTDDCEHDGAKSFTEQNPTLAWYSPDDVEDNVQVEVECDKCGKKLHAYYDYNSVTEI